MLQDKFGGEISTGVSILASFQLLKAPGPWQHDVLSWTAITGGPRRTTNPDNLSEQQA